jgi:hypothetical protein
VASERAGSPRPRSLRRAARPVSKRNSSERSEAMQCPILRQPRAASRAGGSASRHREQARRTPRPTTLSVSCASAAGWRAFASSARFLLCPVRGAQGKWVKLGIGAPVGRVARGPSSCPETLCSTSTTRSARASRSLSPGVVATRATSRSRSLAGLRPSDARWPSLARLDPVADEADPPGGCSPRRGASALVGGSAHRS